MRPTLPGVPSGGAAMRRRVWTQEAALEALRRFVDLHPGKLPCSDNAYRAVRAGNHEYPGACVVLRFWGSIGRAFLAAGAAPRRVSLRNVEWTADEDSLLLELSGLAPMTRVAKRLGRSAPACRNRLNRIHGLYARDAQGYMTAADVAREYNCPHSRVTTLIERGVLPATFCDFDTRWQIDPEDALRLKDVLSAPKRTHKGYPPEMGDYRHRYGITSARR